MHIKILTTGSIVPDKVSGYCSDCGCQIEGTDLNEVDAQILLRGKLKWKCPTPFCGKMIKITRQ